MIGGFVEELRRRGELEEFSAALSAWAIPAVEPLTDLEPWKLVSAESAFCVVSAGGGMRLVVKAPLTGGRDRALELESRSLRLRSFGVETATFGCYRSLLVQHFVPLSVASLAPCDPEPMVAVRERVATLLGGVLNAGFLPTDIVSDLRFFVDLRPALVDLGQDLGHFYPKSASRARGDFVRAQLGVLDRFLNAARGVGDGLL